MTRNDSIFTGSIPQLYDHYLGPIIFAPYAADLAARLADLRTGKLLETAAGTGIVTAVLAASLPGVEIVATDLNQAMLDLATAKPGLNQVRFRQADALALPFADREFDAVVCQFGVMFFPDRPAAFREAGRVLKSGGRLLFNCWASVADNPLVAATLRGLSSRYPRHGSWFLERTPHGYNDPEAIRRDLLAAGLEDCRIDVVTRQGAVASAEAAAIGLCQGTPMRAEIEALDPNGLQPATQAAAAAIAAQYGTAAFDVPLCALVVEVFR